MRIHIAIAIVTLLITSCSCPCGRETSPATEAPLATEDSQQESIKPQAQAGEPDQHNLTAYSGKWIYRDFWNEGSTDGPNHWTELDFKGETIWISKGETSKDSGSWTVKCSILSVEGEGTKDSPHSINLKVEEVRQGEMHPSPYKEGRKLEIDVFIDGAALSLNGAVDKITLTRDSH